MPNVVRFALDSARDLYIPGLGSFDNGILDVDANNLTRVARARFLVQPYRAVEIGIVDSATPPPTLPAVPPPPNPDPYPQYPTMDEIVASPELRAASGTQAADATSPLRTELGKAFLSFAGQQPGDPIPVVKPLGDTRPGVWELIHDSKTGHMLHLLAGPNFGGNAAVLAIGGDNGDGTLVLLANKASSRALSIDQRATVTSPTAYGIHATQRSPAAPLVRLEMQASDAAPLLQLLSFGGATQPGVSQHLLYAGTPGGEAGAIFADDGRMRWRRHIDIQDTSGTADSRLRLYSNSGITEARRDHVHVHKSGIEWFNNAGADNTWWPFAIRGGGSSLHIEAGGTTSTIGTATRTSLMRLQNGKVGYFGATPVGRQIVSGSRGGNAAVAGLLSALASAGHITDSTTD